MILPFNFCLVFKVYKQGGRGMLKRLRKRLRRAQSTAEYAIVIGLVIAAAVAMQTYVKRGIQGKVRDATDYTDPDAVGKFGVGGTLVQYEPQYNITTENMVTKQTGTEDEETFTGGGVKREIIGKEKTERTGTTRVTAPTP